MWGNDFKLPSQLAAPQLTDPGVLGALGHHVLQHAIGERERKRSCTPPQQGGQPCEGEATQTEDCRAKNCPGAFHLSFYETLTNIHSVDGQWLEWGEWSTCLGSCEHASRSRGRACTAPAFNGQPCRGDNLDTEECDLHCPGGKRKS